MKKIKDIVSHIDEISKSTKEQLKKSQKYIDALYNGKNKDFKISTYQFNQLKPIVDIRYESDNKNLTIFKDLYINKKVDKILKIKKEDVAQGHGKPITKNEIFKLI